MEAQNKRNFFQRHLIISNILIIMALAIIMGKLSFVFIDYWVDHGEECIVPNVTGLNYNVAKQKIESENLIIEIKDSIFDEGLKPGLIVMQMPKGNTKVKPQRIIYVTIVSHTPKIITIPEKLTDSSASLRRTMSILTSLGIKKERINIKIVESEYKDLVINATYNGIPLNTGTKIPVTATITLEVGEGYSDQVLDSLEHLEMKRMWEDSLRLDSLRVNDPDALINTDGDSFN